jgi:hypothetical protein
VYEVVVPALAGPGLVGAATVAARRWGQRAGGVVSALPAIVGPVLLIGAERHGTAFAAQAATGTLLGLATLAAFALVYGRVALQGGSWRASLAAAWLAAAATGALVQRLDAELLLAMAVAAGSLGGAYRGLPVVAAPAQREERPGLDLVLRMALTAALILALAALAGPLGPRVGGILAALPVLACILSTFVHARHGATAAVALLRGMLRGMAGFVVFCAVVGALVTPLGVGAAFALASAAALLAHGSVVPAELRRPLLGEAGA